MEGSDTGNPYAGLDPTDVTPPTPIPTPQEPKLAPPGWYADPYRSGDRSNQMYWNGTSWEGGLRRTPDIKGLPPSFSTFVAILLALVATCMAMPFFIQSFSFSALPGETYPGWRQDLWGMAFVVGVTSFVLALVSQRKERQRRSRSGRLCAGLAVAVAIIGACVWSLPAIVQAGAGL